MISRFRMPASSAGPGLTLDTNTPLSTPAERATSGANGSTANPSASAELPSRDPDAGSVLARPSSGSAPISTSSEISLPSLNTVNRADSPTGVRPTMGGKSDDNGISSPL